MRELGELGHPPHEHFEPKLGDEWCDALDRAYGELLKITDELRDRVQQLEQREEYREVNGNA